MELLKRLAQGNQLSWIIQSDFNKVTSQEEHFGKQLQVEWQIDVFRERNNHYGIIDGIFMDIISHCVIEDVWGRNKCALIERF